MLRKAICTILYMIIIALRLLVGIVLRLSDWIFYLVGGLFLLVTICCYYMQLESGESLRRMMISSGVMFMIPQIGTVLEALLEVAADRLSAAR